MPDRRASLPQGTLDLLILKAPEPIAHLAGLQMSGSRHPHAQMLRPFPYSF